jgi:2-polyprenyl-3-methyl-5-hydroxy-6-metoxy-1,4-benzoquinol methylase
MQSKGWQRFFKEEAGHYLDNVFTKNTHAEVDFIMAEMQVWPGQAILDIGCGTGRHSLELARRGIACTGIDQSPEMLEIARRCAGDEGLNVEFVLGDAATTLLDRRFDHAICLCEGAFSLLEPGMEPVRYHRSILENVAHMLKPGGMFLLTALNGFRLAREHSDADVASGRFDIMTTAHVEELPAGEAGTVRVVEKGFMPAELKGLLEAARFQVLSIWGGTAGSWNRKTLSLDEIEIMALCRRD